MTWLRENRKNLVGVVAIVLIIFLTLHDLVNIGASNHLQKKINYMSAEAFKSWLDEMKSIKIILEPAKANLDVKEAMNYTFAAQRFANILDWEIEVLPRPANFAEHLYLHIAGATYALNKAISAIATKPPTTLQNFDDDVLEKIGNLTTTIENLVGSVGTVGYVGTAGHEFYDVGPVQQLEEKGVLNQVINYVKQIEATSLEIWEIYGLYG